MKALRIASGRTNISIGRRRLAVRQRRGIVLLVVISLLALFILMGITFALVSQGYRDASKLELLDQRGGDPPETEMDLILGQILYDSAARTSLQYHSLLRDLYGYDDDVSTMAFGGPTGPQGRDTVRGSIVAPIPVNAVGFSGGGQLYTFQVQAQPGSATKNATALSPIPNYYAGRVITFQSGVAANHSTRIVASEWFQPTGLPPRVKLTIESIESKLAGPVTDRLQLNDEFVINGAPFNGTGSGLTLEGSPGAFTTEVKLMYQPHGQPGNFQGGVVGGTVGLPSDAIDVALLPHYLAYVGQSFRPITPDPRHPIDLGGLDETWDAPDLQNMFLAMVPPRVATNAALPIIPSFHRPELVHFIRAKYFSSAGSAYTLNTGITPTAFSQGYQLQRDLLRTMVFRPMPWDHPNFSGSNVNFSSALSVGDLLTNLTGRDNAGNNRHTWDVDNDGDGIPDSVWIDPGLPVITTKDGRRYKRLAAILVKDLDGSINLNAHGNLKQLEHDNYRAATALPASTPSFHIGSSYTPPSGTPTNALGLAQTGSFAARGVGFGPAEVSFSNVFTDTNIYNSLLRTRYLSNSETVLNAVPGYRNAAPGRDALATIKHYGVPSDYANITGAANPLFTPSWFFSPPDTFGVSTIALDVGGQPIWANAGLIDEMRESPYEMALSGESNNADTPYTAAELEALLRYHDPDASQLPDRLLYAARRDLSLLPSTSNPSAFATDNRGSIGPSQLLRNIVSTHSSSIPTPSLLIPSELRNDLATQSASSFTGLKLPGNATILDLYRYRLAKAFITAGLTEPNLTNRVNEEMHEIVPWEFFKGQKFDINRWLGDGLDTDSSGATDDSNIYLPTPPEPVDEFAWPGSPVLGNLPVSFQAQGGRGRAQHTNSVPYFNAGYTYPDDNRFARQLYARHLFCLAMLLLPDTFNPTVPPNYDLPLQSGPPNEYRRAMIRRIAQWAVNCVDFRDQDSVMTPFEFDYQPFDADGWAVDGFLETTGPDETQVIGGNRNTVAMFRPQDRGVVWGMEQPELLISETLAFHDLRVKDTAAGQGANQDRLRSGNPQFDETLDQFRIPQGSAFIELYCPQPTLWGPGGVAQQRQNQKPLTRPVSLGSDPVSGNLRAIWRLAFSKICVNGSTMDPAYTESPWYRVADNASGLPDRALESSTFEPVNNSSIPGAPPGTQPDRYAYFVPYNNIPEFADRSFYITTNNRPQVFPGQYAVIGPRQTTYLGSQDPASANPPASPAGSLWGGNSQQYIRIDPNNVGVFDTNGATTTRTVGTQIRQPVGIVCDIGGVVPETNGVAWNPPPPANWRTGLNVTEPLPYPGPNNNYYPRPLFTPPYDDFYDDPEPGQQSVTFPGQPLDTDHSLPNAINNQGRPLSDLTAALGAATGVVATQTGTQLASTVYLQRLADPTRDWNQVNNPYISVDWATMDVTVFSGEEHTKDRVVAAGLPGAGDFNPDDPPGGRILFRSRQRGFHAGTPVAQYNPWSPVTQLMGGPINLAPFPDRTYFSVDLSNDRNGSYTPTNPDPDRHTLGYLNETIDQITSINGYLGEPANPLPWLTWNNRPFSNPMELLNVPSSSPSRATFEISQAGGYIAPFMSQGPYGNGAGTPQIGFRSPFANLLNFFHIDSNQRPDETRLCRLLDFVEVPSPYAGAERWYNAKVNPPTQSFGELMGGQFTGIRPPGFTRDIYYRPPFNKLSRFRDPGKININTIFDGDVWNAALGQFPTIGDANYFNQVVAMSRKGVNSGTWYGIDPTNPMPTRFANPFRTADSSDLMPGIFRREPAEATFLRPDPLTGNPPSTQPLFHINLNNPVTGPQYSQWTSTGGAGAFRDIERNPYFRHQALQKMGNTFTTQSNCFAVWITIGYFEVEDVVLPGASGPRYWTTMRPDEKAAWPDGLMLGQEVGADSGEINRHRAFYMIDRSIPVGFIPGSKLNTDDCVLVRRLIE